jgi:hypothetical protein
MSALNFLDITPKFSILTMFEMFTDEELFLAFEAICSTFTGPWYGKENIGYSALLILLECWTTNTCAAGIS